MTLRAAVPMMIPVEMILTTKVGAPMMIPGEMILMMKVVVPMMTPGVTIRTTKDAPMTMGVMMMAADVLEKMIMKGEWGEAQEAMTKAIP